MLQGIGGRVFARIRIAVRMQLLHSAAVGELEFGQVARTGRDSQFLIERKEIHVADHQPVPEAVLNEIFPDPSVRAGAGATGPSYAMGGKGQMCGFLM